MAAGHPVQNEMLLNNEYVCQHSLSELSGPKRLKREGYGAAPTISRGLRPHQV